METVTVVTPGTVENGYGEEIDDWRDWATSRQAVEVLGVEPISSTEDNDGRQAVITGLRVYLPSGTILGARNRVLVRGATYQVEGEPADWRSPFGGAVGGLVVGLKRVEG